MESDAVRTGYEPGARCVGPLAIRPRRCAWCRGRLASSLERDHNGSRPMRGGMSLHRRPAMQWKSCLVVSILWQLADAAEPLINSLTTVAYGRGSDGRGLSYWSVESEGARGLQLPLTGSGMSTSSGNDGRLQPSGLALAHAIWLVNRRLNNSQSTGELETPFQRVLAPSLLKAYLNRQAPYALLCAVHFGGAVADKFLIGNAHWTRDATWQNNYSDFEYHARSAGQSLAVLCRTTSRSGRP